MLEGPRPTETGARPGCPFRPRAGIVDAPRIRAAGLRIRRGAAQSRDTGPVRSVRMAAVGLQFRAAVAWDAVSRACAPRTVRVWAATEATV